MKNIYLGLSIIAAGSLYLTACDSSQKPTPVTPVAQNDLSQRLRSSLQRPLDASGYLYAHDDSRAGAENEGYSDRYLAARVQLFPGEVKNLQDHKSASGYDFALLLYPKGQCEIQYREVSVISPELLGDESVYPNGPTDAFNCEWNVVGNELVIPSFGRGQAVQMGKMLGVRFQLERDLGAPGSKGNPFFLEMAWYNESSSLVVPEQIEKDGSVLETSQKLEPQKSEEIEYRNQKRLQLPRTF